MKIYKYPIQLDKEQIVELPYDAKILSIQAHRNKLYLWALVDEHETYLVENIIHLYRTGYDEIPSDITLQFLGTSQIDCGELILHAFLLKKKEYIHT